jgi:hypothetical protein
LINFNFSRLSPEERDEEKTNRQANLVSLDEFKVITQRVDTMETSIGTIVNRVSLLLSSIFLTERNGFY